MSWFKRKPKYAQITSVSQVKAHLREFMLDTQIPNALNISEELGCPPISDDVAEREEEESDKRVTRIEPLIPLLHGYSMMMAEVFAKNFSNAMISEGEGEPPALPPVMKVALTKASRKMLEELMVHLLMGAVSQMVELEFLELPERPVKRKR